MNTNYDLTQYDSNALASILSSIQSSPVGSGSCLMANGSWYTVANPLHKQSNFRNPKFDMSFYQSENGGFIMELKVGDDSNYVPKSKLFIIKDVENMGTEIQNILLQEILKG
jgi:hypothetical protein